MWEGEGGEGKVEDAKWLFTSRVPRLKKTFTVKNFRVDGHTNNLSPLHASERKLIPRPATPGLHKLWKIQSHDITGQVVSTWRIVQLHHLYEQNKPPQSHRRTFQLDIV